MQDGWTAVQLAARYGHKKVVQELCKAFGTDFLHRKKVRAMQTISGSEWLSDLWMYYIIMCGCTYMQDDCHAASYSELYFSFSSHAVLVAVV